MEYAFTLKFKLGADMTDMDAVAERLGAQGCTDALLGLGQPGCNGLDLGARRQKMPSLCLAQRHG